MTPPFSFPQQSQDQPAGPYTPQRSISPVQSSAVGLHGPEYPSSCWATASLIGQALTGPWPFISPRKTIRLCPPWPSKYQAQDNAFSAHHAVFFLVWVIVLQDAPPNSQILACGLSLIALRVLTLELLSGCIHAKLPWLSLLAQDLITVHLYLSHICEPQFPVLNSPCLRYLARLGFFFSDWTLTLYSNLTPKSFFSMRKLSFGE